MANRTMYDGTYAGWQALQATVPVPVMFAYGSSWTSAQIATLPAATIKIPIDNDGTHSATTVVIDVENGDVTSAPAIASWINAVNSLLGGYAQARPTVYINSTGSYYAGGASDVLTPLKDTYGLHPGVDYDIWIADRTGSLPAGPMNTFGVPCVAWQYLSFTQTGHQYDVSVVFDATWHPSTGPGGGPPSAAFLNPPAMYETTIGAAVTDWNAWTGTVLGTARRYYAVSSFPTSDSTLAYYAANNIKCCLNLCPKATTLSSADRSNLASMLAYWKGQGLDMEVSLWGEPYNNGLTASEFIAMFQYYGPTVRAAGIPVVFCTSVYTVAHNNELSYYPGDSYVDKVATDFYGLRWAQGLTLDQAALVADNASPRKPFCVWEYSTSPGTQVLAGDTATFDGSNGTWTSAGNCSLAHIASGTHSGAGACSIAATAAGSMAAASFAAASITSQGLACSPGDTISGGAWVRAVTAARTVQIGAAFYDSGGGLLATVYDSGNAITDTTAGYLPVTGAVTAPGSAARCRLQVQVLSAGGAGETHDVDDPYLANTTANGITTAQAEGFLAYLASFAAGRPAAFNGDYIFFNSGVPTPSLNQPVQSGSDFRLPSILALYRGLLSGGGGGGGGSQAFTVIRSVNGVVKEQTAGTPVSLYYPPVPSI